MELSEEPTVKRIKPDSQSLQVVKVCPELCQVLLANTLEERKTNHKRMQPLKIKEIQRQINSFEMFCRCRGI